MRTFRDRNAAGLIFGLIFIVGPLTMMGLAVFGSRSSFKDISELLFVIFFCSLFLAPGVGIILFWKNNAIKIDDQGILQVGWVGKVTFSASWGEISEVSRRYKTRGYVLHADKRKMEIPYTVGDLTELLANVRHHLPQVDFGPWDHWDPPIIQF